MLTDEALVIGLRFGQYAGLLLIFGILAFKATVPRWAGFLPQRPLVGAALLLPVLSAALMAVSIAQMMGVSLAALDWPMASAILFTTDMGWAFTARLALLLLGSVLVGASQFARRRTMLAALVYATALATLAWSGHAAATEGNLGLVHRLNDVVHLLAAGLWIGAIACFGLLVALAHRGPAGLDHWSLLEMLENFRPYGIALVGILSLTGLINAEIIFGLQNSLSVAGGTYGLWLMLKLVLVGLMLVCAVQNARLARSHRYVSPPAEYAAEILGKLRHCITAEIALAIGVVICVAIIGTMMPDG